MMAQAQSNESDFAEAEVVAATPNRAGSVVTFAVNGGGNIPSDGTPHKVTIFRDRYPLDWNMLLFLV